ncbi:GMC oxidoreductase [Obba rivulosa]|uniref:GMC oxidoreductase n=1 Tax=Obba rivulosa TaxID=1052685 RepID=A0A8E2ASM8_9APHY|nr:GMC oxidoreductase [Obba rivulosa]
MGLVASSPLKTSPELYATKLDRLDDKTEQPAGTDTGHWKQYDYVIVGGGTAGCVLASRLSQDPNTAILLLEAGRSNNKGTVDPSHIPISFQRLYKTEVDWSFETIPQRNANNRRIYYPRGKVLGGCSGTNANVVHHCAPQDFEAWETNGATGWGYETMSRYLRKAEKYIPSPLFPRINADDRGTDGLIFTRKSEIAPANKVTIEACKAFGIPNIEDVNTPQGTLGATEFLGTVDANGKRSSTASAYLTPAVLARPNLVVAVNTRVERAVFYPGSADTNGIPRPSGVILSTSPSSPRYGVRVLKEVILCAGAVATPQLLMLSGIGPAEELDKLGIQVVKDLPHVGHNLSDHVGCGSLIFRTRPGTGISLDYLKKPLYGVLALVQWLLTGSGPLSSVGPGAAAFLRSDDPALQQAFASRASPGVVVHDATSGAGVPDLEIIWGASISLDNGFKKPPSGCEGITISAVALHPESVGSIKIVSRSVWDAPLIDLNYFASENDLNVLMRGVRFILRLVRTEPLAPLLDLESREDGKVDGEDVFWPGNADPDKVSDEELKAWIRKNVETVFHPVSTARMGSSPENSVVDATLRVHGVDGLRVVDASVFPTQVSGHPCAIVVAMAERAAELIREG